MNFIILAGGSGTRLWPLSRALKPKQFSQLVTEMTMLEDTVARLKGIAGPDNTYISTNANFAPIIKQLLPQINDDHYIIEPEKRDTGPAMAYVAVWMNLKDPDEPMAFIPSDHYIRDPKLFRQTFQAAQVMIKKTDKLFDIAITPTLPNPNLGYTRIGKLAEDQNGIRFYRFLGHTEKPNYETAKKFIEQGNYLWHANYYMWTPKKFVEAYKTYAPTIGDWLDELAQAIQTNNHRKLADIYGKMEKISIDYAVTEKLAKDQILIIRGDFGWADLGSWDMLYDELSSQADQNKNLIKAHWHGIDTRNSLVYAPTGKLITTIGINDLVIVDTADALLVANKERSQDVKKIVELLKKKGLEKHL